jgi:hypothetical protein
MSPCVTVERFDPNADQLTNRLEARRRDGRLFEDERSHGHGRIDGDAAIEDYGLSLSGQRKPRRAPVRTERCIRIRIVIAEDVSLGVASRYAYLDRPCERVQRPLRSEMRSFVSGLRICSVMPSPPSPSLGWQMYPQRRGERVHLIIDQTGTQGVRNRRPTRSPAILELGQEPSVQNLIRHSSGVSPDP